MPDNLVVKSHVARDLLQTAGLFADPPKAIWEYVVNGLEYVDESKMNSVVHVNLDFAQKHIRISDNGRGMTWQDLQNFFVMHGENIDRREGSRGRFGTGKSAAFGIGKTLTVRTVRHRKRSSARLTREKIEAESGGDNIPIDGLECEETTDSSNGTVIEIDRLHVFLDVKKIVGFIERQLTHYKPNAKVYVNGELCCRPSIEFVNKFEREPNAQQQELLGPAKLVLKISKKYLDPHLQGVAIFSQGIFYECRSTEDGYIFGEVDVPRLHSDNSDPPPFDASRSLKLNRHNQLVKTIYNFIDPHIDEVKQKIKQKKREERDSAERKKLEEHAKEIAKVLNAHFESESVKVPKRCKATAQGPGYYCRPDELGNQSSSATLNGSNVPTKILAKPPERPTSRKKLDIFNSPRMNNTRSVVDDEGNSASEFGPGKGETQRQGGFRVEYQNMGQGEKRSTYASEIRTIFINLDHPQIVAARGPRPPESPEFRRLVVEIAFSEYSRALAREMTAEEGNFIDILEAIEFMGDTLEHLSRCGAHLWER